MRRARTNPVAGLVLLGVITAAVTVSALFAAGCPRRSTDVHAALFECTDQSQCARPAECVAWDSLGGPRQTCEIRCSSDSECPEGMACRRGSDMPDQTCGKPAARALDHSIDPESPSREREQALVEAALGALGDLVAGADVVVLLAPVPAESAREYSWCSEPASVVPPPPPSPPFNPKEPAVRAVFDIGKERRLQRRKDLRVHGDAVYVRVARKRDSSFLLAAQRGADGASIELTFDASGRVRSASVCNGWEE